MPKKYDVYITVGIIGAMLSVYAFVEARQVDQNLLDANSGQPALFQINRGSTQ